LRFFLKISIRFEDIFRVIETFLINVRDFQRLRTEKNNLFEGGLYQYFEGLYYERYHRRNITISITILFVPGERKKKNNKTDILRVRSKRKKKLLLKKKYLFQ
jgi:hypothetical protein